MTCSTVKTRLRTLAFFFFLSTFFWSGQTVFGSVPIVLRVGGEGGFHLPSKNDTAPQDRANRAIVDAFERANPQIQLQNAQGLRISGPMAEASLLMQFAGGTAPDVIYVNFRQSATYINQGFLLPLDSYVAQDPTILTRLNPQIVSVLRDVGNGHIYSIPYAQFVQALYYRRDMFQSVGLDPNKPPTTWDQFYSDAQRLTDQSHGVWGFEFNNDPDASAYWWCNFLWQAGGDVIKKNAQGKWVAAFNSPAGVEALDFYKKLMTAKWRGPDGKMYKGVATHTSTPGADRANGKCGMWFQYQSSVIANTSDATTLNPNLVGIAPMPRGPTGITANEINAAMWGISSQIKDPKVIAAAWKFVKFMGSDEADRIRTKAFVEAGLGNTINPVTLIKYGYPEEVGPGSRAWLDANKTLFAHGKPEPYGENMNEIYVLLGQPLGMAENNPNADSKTLLDESAAEINSKLTGYVPAVEMRQRRAGAWSVFALLLGTLLAVIANHVRSWLKTRRTERLADSRSMPKVVTKYHVVAWLFLIPAVVSTIVWAYFPLFRGLVMAFENYRIIGPAHFVGLDNFIDLFYQPTFWYGVRNSFVYTLFSLGLGFCLPILLGLGLSEIPRGKLFFRMMYYLPAATSPLVIALLWKSLEDSTPNGLLNRMLALAGHSPIGWLTDPKWAMLAVVLPSIWAAAGPGSIIYLAALKGIHDEMYEAAELDGAGIWTKITQMTLPTLKPLILINLVGVTIGTFQAFDNIFVMTGGGPTYATHTLGLEIWSNAFLYLRFGYATAAAWVMGMMLVGFTLFQLNLIRRLRYSATTD